MAVIFFYPITINAQQYVELMHDENARFSEIQEAFNTYWQNKTPEKGKGWKQFRRWEYMIEQRIPDRGRHLDPSALWEVYQQSLQAKNMRGGGNNSQWNHMGPYDAPGSGTNSGGIGRINTIAFHPTDNDIIWIGAPAGGVWNTTDGGATWSTNTDLLPNLGVSDIALDPANSSIMYMATGDKDGQDTYSYGLLKSTDGGNSWNTTGMSYTVNNGRRVNRILIHPTNSNILLVATSAGIYRSTDAGASFALESNTNNYFSMEFKPGDPNTVYAGNSTGAIYKSTNNGQSWSQVTSGLPATSSVGRVELAVSNNNANYVYALFADNDNGFYGLYRSTNSGTSFTQRSSTPNILGWDTDGGDSGGQGWYDLAIAVDPTDVNRVTVGGVNIWQSTNGGTTWSLKAHWYGGGGADYAHADQHKLIYSPDGTLFAGNDGGIYYTTNNGSTWNDLSNGIHITQYYRLGLSAQNANLVICGAQDNGSHLTDSPTWDKVMGGDGMEALISPTDDDVMYASVYYGDIRKSINGGNSFSSVAPNADGAWVTPYVMHASNQNILWAGYDDVYMTTNGANSWSTISNNLTGGTTLKSIAVAKSSTDVIYAATYDDIYKTTNGGSNWTNITSGLPSQNITYIAVHPTAPNTLWVTFSGYNASNKVYRSTNGGSSWTNITGSLPNLPVNCIVYREGSDDELYVGTDVGVYTRDNNTNDWIAFNNGLPNVIVSELEIHYASNRLRAATYGRGLWEASLSFTAPPEAAFTADVTEFCDAPATVSFTNSSLNGVNFTWDFGDGNTSTEINPSHTYNATGTYTVTLIVEGSAGFDNDTIAFSSLIVIDQGNPCIVTMEPDGTAQTQTGCEGTIYDSGGPIGNYPDQSDSYITISPIGAQTVTLNFSSFDVELGSGGTCDYDYVEIFDGPNSSSPSLGRYCNTTGNPGIVVSSGNSITILLHSDEAANGSGFEINWECQLSTAPPSSAFSANFTETCTGEVSFTDLSTNGPTSWQWDFGDGNSSNDQNPTHTYTQNGTYNVTLQTSNQNGQDIHTENSYIVVNRPQAPNTTGASSTIPASLTLTANGSGGTLNWYSNPSGGSIINTGNSYTTPLLSTTTTYYVEETVASTPIFGGPDDNTFGGGAYYTGNQHLVFNCYQASTLVSVKVYANGSGNRVIELRNSSGTVLLDTAINIPDGESRVYLNFDLPVDNDLQLGTLSNSQPDLYRNSDGPSYPYDIGNLISITNSSAGVPGYYYFFYDWEIQPAPCVSERVPVLAEIEIVTNTYKDELPSLNIYPNPAHSILNIDCADGCLIKSITLFDASGKVVWTDGAPAGGSYHQTISVRDFAKGNYLIGLDTEKGYFTERIVIGD